ncbi:MAG: hypothetical protein HY331_00885 [Chloroflexi bacterium]|nr:hypothetical protein [Chloroflexota bacterium]
MMTTTQPQAISPWVNPVTRALREGKVCIGTYSVSFPTPATAQIAALAGFGFFAFDMEHSSLPINAVEPICTAAKLAGITPIAGPAGIADFLISRPLDCGAMGVIVPHVSTREETELTVNACRYVPKGTRGLIGFGAHTGYSPVNAAKWVEAMNEEILVAVKVESAHGIQQIDEIAAVRGLDAILIGPGDLSASLGIPGQPGAPLVREAIERTLAACKRHGIAGGLHVGTAESAAEWADRGATFITCGVDGLFLLQGAQDTVARARGRLGERML